ncbi:MAG: hypothetical protein DIU53_000190 [Thermobifida fusca]|jgi:hypothetical protein|nr:MULTISPECIES: hypothetical protein [Thermobifida]MBO2530337.1 hypothetical protein [Thermobifida sp.]MDD6793587.1 hypothetical protein [Thermobifida fusca]PZN59773.1 MAG: hypothetical protein DIU53_16295 [Thermobifida fusca]QOS58754.1 hypothetical protein IM867_15745 [Thermobifida fusca]
MRSMMQTVGFVLMLMGISGAIDHLYVQPIMGLLLNVFNRVILPHLDFLAGYELYANLSLAVVGVVVMAAANLVPE